MSNNSDVPMQEIPAKVYRTAERVTIAAPMPGLEPGDIAVDVSRGPRVTLHGDFRGDLKGEKEVLMNEWTPGPYHREIDLPAEVDGNRANVTYNNGVLVVVLPVAEQTQEANLKLDEISATQGARVGNQGRNAEPPDNRGSGATGEATTSYTSGDVL